MDSEQIDLLVARASEARKVGDQDGEIEAYEQIRELDPTHPDALSVLGDHYTLREDWKGLAGVLLDKASQNPAALETVAKMYEEQVGDPQAAFLVWTTLVRRTPSHSTALDDLARVAATVEGWDDVRELAEELEDAHPTDAARVWRVVAARTGDRTALAHACRLVPGDRESFSDLGAALRTDERWRDLAALLARAVDNEENSERRALLCTELGELCEKELAQPAEAITWFERARTHDPEAMPAITALHRLYRERETWTELAALVPHLLATSQDVELHAELAGVLDRVGEVEHAIAAYRSVLELDAEHKGALEALARLYEGEAKPQQAVEMLKRLVEQTRSPKPRADLLTRIGHFYLGQRDAVNARLHFAQALALDLANAQTREGMGHVHVEKDELVAAGEEFTRAAQLSATPADKVRRLREATRVYVALRDLERAQQCVKEILELEPGYADARRLLQETKQWGTLWPLLEQDMARDPTVENYVRGARVALELGDKMKALELYELATANEPTAALLIERADALVHLEKPTEAAAIYERLAATHLGELDRTKIIEVYLQLSQYEKVLEVDPKHRRALEALVEQHLAGRRHDEAIARLRTILDVVTPEERVGILERIGDLYRDATFDVTRAITTYKQALEIDPKNHRVLQRMLDLQCATAQWPAAIDTIARFIAHEIDPVKRGLYHFAAAEIRRFELDDRPRAIVAYNHALEELFKNRPLAADVRSRALDIFRTLAELVAADKNWTFLEECFIAMLSRLPGNDPAHAVLWQSLAELYHGPIADPERAIVAFEKAHEHDPEKSPERAAVLAELYASHAKTRDPSHPDTIRVRGRSAMHAGRVDEAWCAARTLVFLETANAEEQALYTRYQDQETRKATVPLEQDAWLMVRHRDEDQTISKIFSLTWFGPMVATARPARTFEIKPKQRLAVEDSPDVLAKIFRYVGRVLDITLPEVFVQDRVGHIWFANCVNDQGLLAPALVVGRDLTTGADGVEIAAWVAALAAMLIPSYVLRLALPNEDDLEAAVAAAAQLCGRRVGREHVASQRDRFASEIEKRLTGEIPESLHAAVAKLPEKPDLARWRDALGMTARRASFLVCGRLSAAARLISREGGAPDAKQLADLVTYSVSPAYFAARAHLGVQVTS